MVNFGIKWFHLYTNENHLLITIFMMLCLCHTNICDYIHGLKRYLATSVFPCWIEILVLLHQSYICLQTNIWSWTLSPSNWKSNQPCFPQEKGFFCNIKWHVLVFLLSPIGKFRWQLVSDGEGETLPNLLWTCIFILS